MDEIELEWVVTRACDGQRLDVALVAAVDAVRRDVSRRQIKTWIEAGHVRVEGRAVRMASRMLRAGEQVALRAAAPPTGRVSAEAAVWTPEAGDILYEDGDILAVCKPAGLPTQGTRDVLRDHLEAAVRRYLAQKGATNPYVALHHRLDVETSGIVVLATSTRANAGLARAFRERLAHKTYRAICFVERPGRLAVEFLEGGSWKVDNHLGPEQVGRQTRQREVRSGGDRAVTDFAVVAQGPKAAEIEAHPHTGRLHQIRAHLAQSGIPIAGDPLYGGTLGLGALRAERVMLHARALELAHPVSGKPLQLSCEVPADFARLRAQAGLVPARP